MRRRALIVATSQYADSGLAPLPSVKEDATGLHEVLSDPQIGRFTVEVCLDSAAHDCCLQIEDFFASGTGGELLLLYITGHGMKDAGGELYFPVHNTRIDRLNATAVSASFVKKVAKDCKARAIVLILDTCFSGAFGNRSPMGAQVGVADHFKDGRGQIVIASSDSFQHAMAGEATAGGGMQPSLFSSHVIHGLRTGEADLDEDGEVSSTDLYTYVEKRMRTQGSSQRPQRWAFKEQGELVLAAHPGALPAAIRKLMADADPDIRLVAVAALTELLAAPAAPLALAARRALETLKSDRDRLVSEKAASGLEARLTSIRPPAPPPSGPQAPTGQTGQTADPPRTEIRAEPFQERLLEQIALSRQQGRHRNLLVAATGTGKTVMAALDYARLRAQLARSRLLFVAHREEILTQSLATFRHVLHEESFGELWVNGRRPRAFEYVFASIQSLNSTGLAGVAPDDFDVLIVDEFHHAAAQSYQTLLTHAKPVELLGLTATPERADGLSILDWFGGRIAAELRLWDAIDQGRLAPFVYYGIHDGLDLSELPWKRDRGYDVDALSKLVTGNHVLAKRVIRELGRRVGSVASIRAFGFCVSVAHARFMAQAFSSAGIPAVAIWSSSPDDERRRALHDLADRRINVVFSVDLFNEGVDVPTLDALLMLRPTDSPTLFIQQLGRGLRKSPGKRACIVLDFVGHHRKEFRFDRRLRALLGGTRKDLETQVEAGFPFLPTGCRFELDRVAKEIVLQSIRNAIPSRWKEKVDALLAATEGGRECSLQRFLELSGLELEDLYGSGKGWSSLRSDAHLPVGASGAHEEMLRRAVGRLLHIDDMTRIDAYRGFLASDRVPDPRELSGRQQRLLRMLVASLEDEVAAKNTTLREGAQLLWKHPQVLAELRELLDILAAGIERLPIYLGTHADVPLEIHARYTRIEIFAAFGVGDGARAPLWVTGVHWAKESEADLLAFTLDKTSGEFSPRTSYRDYAIDRNLIHWESQSVTRADGETGRRYQQHASMGSCVMLFARNRADERAFYFLGPATYVKHESEQPMAIVWRLEHALPADLFATFAAAVA